MYTDKLGRAIAEGDFIVYPHCAGSSSASTKIGFVVALRETPDKYGDRKPRLWLSCITAEEYMGRWRVQNKGRAVPIQNVCECVVVLAPLVPAAVRTMLKEASVK